MSNKRPLLTLAKRSQLRRATAILAEESGAASTSWSQGFSLGLAHLDRTGPGVGSGIRAVVEAAFRCGRRANANTLTTKTVRTISGMAQLSVTSVGANTVARRPAHTAIRQASAMRASQRKADMMSDPAKARISPPITSQTTNMSAR